MKSLDRLAADPAFIRWFGTSITRDQNGVPTLAYRGEHGPWDDGFQSRCASLTFGTAQAASTYALDPNNPHDLPEASRVTPCVLRIERPVFADPDDPFVDLPILANAIGREACVSLAVRLSAHIVATGNWEENFQDEWGSDLPGLLAARPSALDELYVMAWPLFDDHEAVSLMRSAGFDGAIHGGMGVTALEPEWRIFDPDQALPVLCSASILHADAGLALAA